MKPPEDWDVSHFQAERLRREDRNQTEYCLLILLAVGCCAALKFLFDFCQQLTIIWGIR